MNLKQNYEDESNISKTNGEELVNITVNCYQKMNLKQNYEDESNISKTNGEELVNITVNC